MTTEFRILALNTAGRLASAAMIGGDRVLASWKAEGFEGLAANLPPSVADLIARTGAPAMIAVCVGPGSFTGLRAGLSLAAGLAAGYGAALVGVTQAEALKLCLPDIAPRALWCAIDSKRGRIFLDQGEGFFARDLSAVAMPAKGAAIAVAGDAGMELAAILAARDVNVMLTGWREAPPLAIARAAVMRLHGELPALTPEPLYVDEPAVSAPKNLAVPA